MPNIPRTEIVSNVIAFPDPASAEERVLILGFEASSVAFQAASRAWDIGGVYSKNVESLLNLIKRLAKASPDAIKRCHEIVDRDAGVEPNGAS